MTFLAPLTGLIAAAIALPALLALYLLKLRRKPVRVSSTLLWERATQELQVNAPLRWLRRSLLLLVQLLALASLLVAIARPVISGAGVDAPRVVFVIDRSASMSARDGVDPATLGAGAEPVTRLEAAKRRAVEMVRGAARASGGGGVMVVALAGEALALTGLDASPADARTAIGSITPTDQPAEPDRLFDLLAALRAGEGTEGEKAAATTVVIFSDGDLAPRQMRSLPADVTVRLERVGPPVGPVRNVGIVAINARRDHDDPERLRVFARLINAGDRAVDGTIELVIDGEVVAAQPLAIEPAAAAAPFAPTEASVTFEVKRAAGGLAVVRLGGRDLLPSDDAAGLRVPAAARPGIVLVHPVGVAPDPWVKGLLEDMDLAWLEMIEAPTFERVASGAEPTRGGRSIGQIDLVVLDQVMLAKAPGVPTLSFAGTPGLEGVSFKPADLNAKGKWRFTSWNRQHPLLRFAAFDAVDLAPPGELAIAGDGASAQGLVLATGEPMAAPTPGEASVQRPLIAAVERDGVRHVLVAFSPWRSSWPKEASFPLVMQNAVDFLALRADGPGAGGSVGAGGGPIRTTDPVRVHAVAGAKDIVVTGPLSRSVPTGADASLPSPSSPPSGGRAGTGGGLVELGAFEIAGVYTLSGADPRETPVAVNLLDARESTAALVDSPRLPGVDVGGGGAGAGGERNGGGGGTSPGSGDLKKGGREVWAWFVLGAFALATIEWMLYARRMRG